jgi:cbb3-type cytochrome oxidase subunit 3
VFLGIWYWAWRPHHHGTFDRLARLPMSDDDPGATR